MEKLETLAPDTKVGPFRVVRPMNEVGGMATVYLAQVRESYRRHDLPDQMILKIAKAQYEDFLKTEADMLSRLTSQRHIVKVYPLPITGYLIYWTTDTVKIDKNRSEKLCYMAMEYVGGGTLRHMMEMRGGRPLPPLVVTGIARQIADGLEHVHLNRIVHLDVKPENVLFRPRRLSWLRSSVPEPVLCDFGLARNLAHRHALVIPAGTEDYMPPELYSDLDWNQVTYSADVYMLGVVMYEMLTGRVPFENLGKKLDNTTAPRPIREFNRMASPQLNQVVMTALERDPARRYPTAAEARRALECVPSGIDADMVLRQAAAGIAAAGLLTGLVWGGAQLRDTVGPSILKSSTPTVTPTERIPTATVLPTLTRMPLPSSTPVNTNTPSPPTPVNTSTPPVTRTP
jgi:serine/threonine protein kinase